MPVRCLFLGSQGYAQVAGSFSIKGCICPASIFLGSVGCRIHATRAVVSSRVYWCTLRGAFAVVRMDKLAEPRVVAAASVLTFGMRNQRRLPFDGVYPSNRDVYLRPPLPISDLSGNDFILYVDAVTAGACPEWARFARSSLSYGWPAHSSWYHYSRSLFRGVLSRSVDA